jgi:FSR family fosmidomycin resistance protein-like MFS transporter
MQILRNAKFLAASLAHLAVDTLNGLRTVLFTYLSKPMGLSNADLGLLGTLYILIASLMQLLFGYLSDKIGPRWLIAGGAVWIGVFYSLGFFAAGTAGLVLFIIAGIGSASVHPAGTMQATEVGRQKFAGRETTAAAFFFLFGQMGFFIGPLLGGRLLDSSGQTGLLVITVFCLPIGIYAAWALRNTGPSIETKEEAESPKTSKNKQRVLVLAAFALLATFQSWTSQNIVTFLPKYLSDLGQIPSQYGFMTALYMAGSAVGNVVGGYLADRYGKRRVAAVGLTLGSLPLAVLALIGLSPWLYILLPLAGLFIGPIHSIVVVLGQRLIPGGKAWASGLILSFLFASGAVGVFFSGYMADAWGFPTLFLFTTGLVLAAAGLTVALPKR